MAGGAMGVSLNSRFIKAHFRVDVIHISLMDELLAHHFYAYVCFIHGISQDAFDPWWKVSNEGQRMPWGALNRIISGGWMAFGQNSTQLFGNPSWMSMSLLTPSVDSSLRGRPHRVSVSSSGSMDVVQGIRSWLMIRPWCLWAHVQRASHGRDSSHHGNDPAAIRQLATQPSR
jgi:hypothetical protein